MNASIPLSTYSVQRGTSEGRNTQYQNKVLQYSSAASSAIDLASDPAEYSTSKEYFAQLEKLLQ
jgi:hypothetical protein